MSNHPSRLWNLGLLSALILLVNGCLRNDSSAPVAEVTEPQIEPALVFTPVPQADYPAESSEEVAASEAAIKPISIDRRLPSNLQPTEALAEVLQLADSGVDENVLLAYVTNSVGMFILGPDELIYLNDIGVSAPVVTAMLEHDRMVKESAATAFADVAPAAERESEMVFGSAPSYSSWPEPSEASVPEVMPVNYSTEAPPYAPAPISDGSVSYFYDSLAPYGSWMDVEGYGRCWQPSVVAANRDWQPYCDRGHWVYSSCGWYWVSDYSWGWAPFHYGRWFRHSGLGWCWAPDTTWGPSWVSWRYSDQYCGWAPLPPRAHYTGSGFSYYGRVVGANFSFGLSSDCYTFVPFEHFHERQLSRHALGHEAVGRFIHKTVVSTKISGRKRSVVNEGLPPQRVATATRRAVHKVTLREVTPESGEITRPERLDPDGRTLSIVRPNWRPPVRKLTPEPEVRQASSGVPSAPEQPSWLQTRQHASTAAPRAMMRADVQATLQTPSGGGIPRPALREIRSNQDSGSGFAPEAPVGAMTTTPVPAWHQPRRVVPRILPAQVHPAEMSSAPQQALIVRSPRTLNRDNPLPAAPWQGWQTPLTTHQEQVAQVVRQSQASWQTPSHVAQPRIVVPESQPVRIVPAAAAAPSWERPRQEIARPVETPHAAAAPHNSGWQTPSHQAPSPSPSPRVESSSRSKEDSSSSRSSSSAGESRSRR